MNPVQPSTHPSLAFTNGLRGRDRHGYAFRIQVEQAGTLVVTSGSIIACDPGHLVLDRFPAYTTSVPPGRYPVLLSCMQSEQPYFGSAVAFAQLRLSKQEPVRWEMAVRPGEDISTLEPGYFFGYGVDSATGCFLDQDILAWLDEQPAVRSFFDRSSWQTFEELEEHMKRFESMNDFFYEKVIDPLVMRNESKYGAGSVTLNPATGGNIVAFASGPGDGSYPSYFLYAADGSLTGLITDFFESKGAQWDSPLV